MIAHLKRESPPAESSANARIWLRARELTTTYAYVYDYTPHKYLPMYLFNFLPLLLQLQLRGVSPIHLTGFY